MDGGVFVPSVNAADLAKVKAIADDALKKAEEALDASGATTIDVIPSQSGVLSYTGKEQSPEWNNFNVNLLDISGDTSGIDAGTYEVLFTPKEEYKWADDTSDPKTVTWVINRAIIANVPSQSGELIYDGTEKSPGWDNYDSGKMSISGNVTGTNAGSYSAEFTPNSNYQWLDNSMGSKAVTWSIKRARIDTVPVQSGSVVYSGASQSPTWSGYDSEKMSIGGEASGINAGSYDATFTPTANYEWNDGTTGAKTVQWSIGKAPGSMALDKTILKLSGDSLSQAITVTRLGDGTISASSSNNDITTVSVSGNIVNVTGHGQGSTVITVSVAEGSNHTAPASQECNVIVELVAVGTSWTYTSTQTFTVPVTGTYQVELHGGGGGGGCGTPYGRTGHDYYDGEPGGAGGGSGDIITVELSANEQIAMTIGSGGAGGTYEIFGDGTSSQAGTPSSFGAYLTVAGGGGGAKGGGSSTGTPRGSLANGKYGNKNNTSQQYGNGGDGGAAGTIYEGSMESTLPGDGATGQSGACIITYMGTT